MVGVLCKRCARMVVARMVVFCFTCNSSQLFVWFAILVLLVCFADACNSICLRTDASSAFPPYFCVLFFCALLLHVRGYYVATFAFRIASSPKKGPPAAVCDTIFRLLCECTLAMAASLRSSLVPCLTSRCVMLCCRSWMVVPRFSVCASSVHTTCRKKFSHSSYWRHMCMSNDAALDSAALCPRSCVVLCSHVLCAEASLPPQRVLCRGFVATGTM